MQTPIDDEAVRQSTQEAIDFNNQEEEEKQRAAQAEAEALAAAEKEAKIRANPHGEMDPKQFGAGENATELKNALLGGVRDTVSSVATAPERYADMANGQMVEQGPEYKPDWDPLGGANPMTRTMWGGLLRGAVHFGTMGAAIIYGSRLPGVRGAVSKVASKGVGKFIAGNTIARAGAIGAATDLVSEYSQDDNMMGMLKEHFPALDNPLATQDSDHPIMKTLKNVVEGIGLGVVIDLGWIGIGKARDQLGNFAKPNDHTRLIADQKIEGIKAKAEADAKAAVDKQLRQETALDLFEKTGTDFSKLGEAEQLALMQRFKGKKARFQTWNPPEGNVERAARKADERSANVENQILEKAEEQILDPDFGGYKNKPIADPWQAAPTSTNKTYDIVKSADRIDTDWSAADGSVDSLLTPLARERFANITGIEGDLHEQALRDLLGDNRTKAIIREATVQGKGLAEVFAGSLNRAAEVMGRFDEGLTADQLFASFNARADVQGGLSHWGVEDVIAADLINASLFKNLRDGAIGMRTIADVADLFDVDGPMKTQREYLIVGLTQAKRARYIMGSEFARLQAVDPAQAAKKLQAKAAAIHAETKDAVDMMMELVKNQESDDLLHSVLEAFSMSNKINDWQSFDAWMRQRLYSMGGQDVNPGLLIRELQGVMVHSILSGPKTPVRAAMGTSTAAFLRPLSSAIGGLMHGDLATSRASMASLNAMIQAVPESFQLFKARLNSYWTGDISSVKTRFSEYSSAAEHWELTKAWAEMRGSQYDKAAVGVLNAVRALNDNSLLTYSTKLMAATDDAFTFLLARGRSREKALLEAMDDLKIGNVNEITPELISAYDERFLKEVFDADGVTVKDSALNYARSEVTLTKDIHGFSKALKDASDKNPYMKPFFLFARTGINGLELTAKHLPGISELLADNRKILKATADTLDDVRIFGIENAADLANAKALIRGREAIGTAVVFMAAQHFMNGGLTGNGPPDRQLRAVWEQSGWKPRSIRIGDVWVSYDAFEPFNTFLAGLADIGDASLMMGPEWTERNLQRYALIIGQTAVSKSYLQTLMNLTEMMSPNGKGAEKIIAGLMNNMVPLSGLRNEVGKLINPYMKELNSGIADQIRNRNLATELLTGKPLPTKWDILNGKPIRDWDFPTRAFNFFSPIQFNLDQGPGRTLLKNSNYDLRTTVMSAPDGTPLTDNAVVRAKYAKAIGDQNMEAWLDKLAQRPEVQESVNQMVWDRDHGMKFKDPMKAYLHNKLIADKFKEVKAKAWATITSDPEVQALINQKREQDLTNLNSLRGNKGAAAEHAQKFLESTRNK